MLAGGTLGIGLYSLFRFGIYLAFLGWWAAYRFNVVASGAAGDDDLPQLTGLGDGFVDLFMTFVKWVGSWGAVLMPAVVFAIVATMLGWIDPNDFGDPMSDGLAGLLASGSGMATMVLGALVILGAFFWPIIILCVALGGFGCIYRIDLIVRTVLNTIGVYLFTAMMVFAIDYFRTSLAGVVEARFAVGEDATLSSSFGAGFVISILVFGITVYCEIVAMKLIGLYYHHHKQRFAWDWG